MSVYRERERERDFDDVGSVRSARSGAPRHVTTVRRYKYPGSDRGGDDYQAEDTKIIIREKETVPEPETRERIQYRVVERDRERESDTVSRRGEERDVRSSYRIIERREVSRSPSPPPPQPENRDREIRIIRERERSPEPVEDRLAPPRSPYALEKYSKSTEYFSRPEPQPIIIRQEPPKPIIIREQAQPQQVIIRERSEPSYELIERSEVQEERQVARRPQPPPEEDYYYERRVREIDRPHRHHHHRHGPDHSQDEREYRRHRHDDRDYYSDDDVVYVRRERDDDDFYDRGRERSPHHRRHIAEGVVAGIAAAEIQRRRRKSRGEKPGSHIGQIIGYGTLGGIGAEAITRWRERERSRSGSRDRGRRRSLSRGKAIAGVAALAGLGALAYAAGKKSSKQNTTIINEGVPARSISGARRYSESDIGDEVVVDDQVRSESRHMDPEHRNRRTAQAGLVGAALAGLAERARSKSRGGRSKSRGRIAQAVPIVAAGLGSAAVAGLYERVQARKEEKRARSRSVDVPRDIPRDRSRSLSATGPRRAATDTALVEYGGDPIYSDVAVERRARSRSRSVGRYSDESLSPDRRPRRDRSRSRSRGLAEGAAAAGAAALAAHEITKRRERRRQREREAELRRREDEAASASDVYSPNENPGPYYPNSNNFPPPPMHEGYGPPPVQGGYVDSGYGSAVPPANMNAPREQQPPYNPAEYGTQGGPTLPPQDAYGRDPYDRRYDDPSRRPGPENVSASSLGDDAVGGRSDPGGDGVDGAETPRAATPTTPIAAGTAAGLSAAAGAAAAEHENEHHVKFNLDQHNNRSERERRRERDYGEDGAGDRRRSHERGRDYQPTPSSSTAHERRRSPSPAASSDSGDTIEEPDLTDRFDEHGNPRDSDTDPLARKISLIIAGHGSAGLGGLLDNLFNPGGGHFRGGGFYGRRYY